MGGTALIFGVSGQDGSYMADLLTAEGYRVVGTSRSPDNMPHHCSRPLPQHIEVVEADLRDTVAIASVVATVEPDEIYNFAAFSTGSGMYDQPVAMGDVNGLAVARILEAARNSRKPVRFCQASSSEMFGAAHVSPQNELTAIAPRSPYGAAKAFAHSLIGIARQRDGAFACSAILFNHESPRRPVDFVTRKVTRAAAAIRLGFASELVLGDLQARRDWGDARDVVRAMWLMLQADVADDYVVATGRTHSVAELCGIAFKHVGLDWKHYVRADLSLKRQPEHVQLVGDPTRARIALGWMPSITFEDMIKEMVETDLRCMQSTPLSKGKVA